MKSQRDAGRGSSPEPAERRNANDADWNVGSSQYNTFGHAQDLTPSGARPDPGAVHDLPPCSARPDPGAVQDLTPGSARPDPRHVQDLTPSGARPGTGQRKTWHSVAGTAREGGIMRRLSFDEVHRAAAGRWPDILAGLGVDPAALRNVHAACPGCGGLDRFRFDDRDGRGTWICGGGGETQAGDGFALLTHVYGHTPADALKAVAEYLGIEATGRRHAAPTRRLTRDLAGVLYHELLVLATALGDRLDGLATMDVDTPREQEARAIILAGWKEAGL